MKVLIFGASGLTGEALSQIALQDKSVTEVVHFVRRATAPNTPKLTEIVVDFNQLEHYAAAIKGDVVFNCLGTTLAKAGTKAAQQVIDRDYPIAIARIAAQNGIPLMISVSSVGTTAADTNSNFYLQTKGEMENGIVAAYTAFTPNNTGENTAAHCFFMRPSFLVGKRKEFRLGERVGLYVMLGADYLLFGSLRKYRSMPIEHLAQAMLHLAKGAQSNTTTPEFDEIMRLAALKL
jgi:putative NADH-flavin reductase